MKTPKEVLDLLHNAKVGLNADSQIYSNGRFDYTHRPATVMACEAIIVADPANYGAAWRSIKTKKRWTKPDYVQMSIYE